MSTATVPAITPSEGQRSQSQEFRQLASQIAGSLLRDWVGDDRAGEAVGRISAALAASAAAAKNPTDFYKCTAQSIGQCIAIAALTGIMPGVGATALAYLVPKRPRKDESPQLQFWFSHRGLAALVARNGTVIIPVPVGAQDALQIVDGEVNGHDQDPDNPPMDWDELRGVCVVVKNRDTGQTLFRGWVPKKLIDKRRQSSDTFRWAEREGDWAKSSSPWHQWPVEMAMKTSMHYAISRGWCVIDDAGACRALSAEQSQEYLQMDERELIEGQPLDTTTGRPKQVRPSTAAEKLFESHPTEPSS